MEQEPLNASGNWNKNINVRKDVRDESVNFAVWSWGSGMHGKLGHGTEDSIYVPKQLTQLSGNVIKQVSCAEHRSAVLLSDGSVYEWGQGTIPLSQIAFRDSLSSKAISEPYRITGFDGLGVIKIDCGAEFIVALTGIGNVYVYREKVEIFTKLSQYQIVDIAVGDFHCVALAKTGQVLLWTEPRRENPVYHPSFHTYSYDSVFNNLKVGTVRSPIELHFPEGVEITGIASGGKHSAFIDSEGRLWMWGLNNHGQCGQKDNYVFQPTQITSLNHKHITKVSLGYQHTAILTIDGDVYMMGNNAFGQLGDGTKDNRSSPTLIRELSTSGVTQLACGFAHTAAITELGEVYSTGWNDFGQLGFGKSEQSEFSQFKIVESLYADQLKGNTVYQIACGSNHTVVLSGPKSMLGTDLRAAMNREKMSDVTLVVEDKQIKAHRIILAFRSDYFRSILEERGESKDPVIISGIDYETFLMILEYIYTDGFKFKPGKITDLLNASIILQLKNLEDILKKKRSTEFMGASVIPSEKLAEDLKKAVDSSLFSDLIVECQDGVKIHVHKCMLSIRSSYFKAMLSGGMLESNQSIISLDVSSEAFREVLNFIYSGKVDINGDTCSELLALSNEYDLGHLKLACQLFIEQGVDDENVISIFQAASIYRAPRLKKFCFEFMVKNYKTISKRPSFNELDKVENGTIDHLKEKNINTTQAETAKKTESNPKASLSQQKKGCNIM